jgi:hypothetical protein
MRKALLIIAVTAMAAASLAAIPYLGRGNAYIGTSKFNWYTDGWTMKIYLDGNYLADADHCTCGTTDSTYSYYDSKWHYVEHDGSFFYFRYGSAASQGSRYELRATKAGVTKYGYATSWGVLDMWWDDVRFYSSPRPD